MHSMQLQQLDNRNRDIAVAVDAVARRLEVTSSQVALAWIMARGVIPIVGATRAEQLRENMAAAELQLYEDALADLPAASAFDAGHPYSMLYWDLQIARGMGGVFGPINISN